LAVFPNDIIKTEISAVCPNFYFQPKEVNKNVISNTQKNILLGKKWEVLCYNKRMYKRENDKVSLRHERLESCMFQLLLYL